MKLFILLLYIFVGFPLIIFAHKTFRNPVILKDTPDPTLIKDDKDTFYLFTTQASLDGHAYKIPMYKSANLIDWTFQGSIINNRNCPPIKYKMYGAPDINKIGNKFILYIVGWRNIINNKDIADILIYVSDKANGPYIYKGILLSTEDCNISCIDPELVITKSGDKYLFFGTGGIWYTKLSNNGMKILSKQNIYRICQKWSEGAYIYHHKKYYYLFVSRGNYTNSTYHITIGRSKKIGGPYQCKNGKALYLSDGIPIIASKDSLYGPGHNGDIIKDDKGNYWIPYHCHYKGNKNQIWRSLCLSQILWDKDGWPYLKTIYPQIINDSPYWKNRKTK